MSKTCTWLDEDGRRLWQLLAKAAGADHLKLRSITCTVALNKPVQFTIETNGEIERVHDALEASKQEPTAEAEASTRLQVECG